MPAKYWWTTLTQFVGVSQLTKNIAQMYKVMTMIIKGYSENHKLDCLHLNLPRFTISWKTLIFFKINFLSNKVFLSVDAYITIITKDIRELEWRKGHKKLPDSLPGMMGLKGLLIPV